ncbi:SH2 domain-containing protein 7-like [Cololabis saira]|uniref:SH2 domain-containing protein 7-like n=1 Tax=Cololabis saira TaxID=129043 RepID=UPI002AD3D5F3|nr:SH2 domain-containing protein 7-like [Cololabis saira]
MEQREAVGDPAAEVTDGRLRELASKWFLDTQVPLIVSNGLLPSWFLGFITRKVAEDILREKDLGCFLIRLSDKAIGYILSYKGRDRCRHFVISQSETGQFVVCGDTEGHNTVPELIEHYKMSPIQPFDEYLTSSCFEALTEDLYDMIQVIPRENPFPALRATNNGQKRPVNSAVSATEQQPKWPAKTNKTQEEVPPLPRRSRPLDNSTSNDHDRILYAQLRKQTARDAPRAQHTSQDNLPGAHLGKAERSNPKDQSGGRYSPPSLYSELGLRDSKSKSLPLLDGSSDGEQSYRLSAPPDTPPRLSPKPVRQADSCGPQSERTDVSSRANSSYSMDCMSDSGIYHLAGRPGTCTPAAADNRSLPSEQHCDPLYAEVASEASKVAHDSTYELLPGHKETAKPKPRSSAYEPVEDFRSKQNSSSWGMKNDKWRWLFPDVKKKW